LAADLCPLVSPETSVLSAKTLTMYGQKGGMAYVHMLSARP
jgi:hypothetical protein